jgi:hypothetical protein
LAVTVALGAVEPGALLEFEAVVRNPDGIEIARQPFILARGDTPGVALRHWCGLLSFSVSIGGRWTISVISGGLMLSELSLEVITSA